MIPAKGYLDEALNMDVLMNRLSDHIETLQHDLQNFPKLNFCKDLRQINGQDKKYLGI